MNNQYSDESFWDKIRSAFHAMGYEVLLKAFMLYYTLIADATPAWAKAVIIGALAYLISPLDAIPDVIPVIGYTDDLAMLGGALVTVAAYVTEEIRRMAAEKARLWLS